MHIDKIRERIAEIVASDVSIWDDVLSNTNPGNYGCEFWEAEVFENDVFVNIPERTFTIKNGSFSAELTMGASKGDSSFEETYSKPFSAEGSFDFKGSDDIAIQNIDIDIDPNIYSD